MNICAATGRRGRTHEGLAGGSKQPNSHGRQGLGGRDQGMRSAENPLSSVSFFCENICAATGRRGRTHEGLAGDSKQPSSHGRQGLGGREQVTRSAENPVLSVNFSYENSNSRNEESTRTSVCGFCHFGMVDYIYLNFVLFWVCYCVLSILDCMCYCRGPFCNWQRKREQQGQERWKLLCQLLKVELKSTWIVDIIKRFECL